MISRGGLRQAPEDCHQIMDQSVIDGTILKYSNAAGTRVTCMVCPLHKGVLRTMDCRHIKSHCESAVHIRRAALKCSSRTSVSKNPFPSESRRPQLLACAAAQMVHSNTDVFDMDIDCHSGTLWCDIDDAQHEPEGACHGPDNEQPSSGLASEQIPPVEPDEQVPLSELWNAEWDNQVYEISGGQDLFEDLKASLLDKLFAMPLAPLKDELGIEDEEFDFGIELLPDEIPADSTSTHAKVNPGSPYYPWPSKAKRAVLSWAKELGARDIPSLRAVKQSNEHICELVGNPMRKVTSASGNIFYINDVGHAIAKDYANPLTRFAMTDYPEDGGDGMSQAFHGEKMLLELPSPPAAHVDGKIYFINELLQERSGGYFDPCQQKELELHAMGRAVQYTDAGLIVSDKQEVVPVSIFRCSFEDIRGKLTCGVTASSKKYLKLVPHPLREKANGWMVYSVPLIIFMDDVSGNILKQWNKHHAIYMSNANLPCEMMEKEFCVRFVTSSPHAAPMELMHAMKESIGKATDSGIIAWDCKFDEEVMLDPQGLFLAGNNPMQAEECSHGGLNCNYFCWTCHVGGTKEFKESEAGYNSIFTEGNLRTPEETTSQVCRQFEIALCSGAAGKIAAATTLTGLRDSTSSSIINTLVELGKKLRKREAGQPALTESEVRAKLEKELEGMLQGRTLHEAINPLLGMDGLNIHLDTPTEILHTILLGVVKYFWGQTAFLLEKAKLLNIFQIHLDSLEKEGLNAPSLNADYICHYKGGLIGKHFKSLAQVMPFVVHDLVPKSILDAWTVIGELVVLIWHTKIANTESYLATLSRTIGDFLNITAQCAPGILISKPKFHFLVHLPVFIRHFGPAIVFSTERYESFNHVFRLTCIFSNRRAPSRDTCTTFAHNDTIKHIATGGYWYDARIEQWVHGGLQVVSYLDDHPEQARLLGIPKKNLAVSGMGRSAVTDRSPQQKIIPWEKTRSAEIFKRNHHQSPSPSHYYQGISLVTSEHEISRLGGHVIFQDTVEKKTYIGCIHEILISTTDKNSVTFVALQIFSFMPERHSLLHVPCLFLSNDELVVSGKDIICAVNLQHNCLDAKCTDFSKKNLWQEWTQTDKMTSVMKHKPSLHYLLNTLSIHNYEHIHSLIPESLHEMPLCVADPGAVRKAAVKQLQGKRLAKKSGGESLSALDEDGVRAVFDHGSKKQPKLTSRKQPKSTSIGNLKQRQPVQAAVTQARGANTGTPQYPPPVFSPPVQNGGASSQMQFPPTSTTGDVMYHLPHYYQQYPTPQVITPSQVAGPSSSSFPQSSVHQRHLPSSTFALSPKMSPWTSQAPSFYTSSSHSHST
ncbi:hypothetical protein AZE42_10828 [Rhizopogon vesiculosus]|uniref:Uncharacterized protein n=1 Tax=Rhizopogon vesiculosus TaxID=180088 RepID=A0A1J8R5A7_9AGAM|nr:hypothetical protein AZE42_10828 [Rhizopogon vesiculosus]